MNKRTQPNTYGRRKFITTMGKLAGTSMIVSLPGVSSAEKLWQQPKTTAFNVQQVIDIISNGRRLFK